ncbi:MAG: hypothetical protein WC701_14335, partial [Kiritimatiellales bacterium]
RAGGLVWTGSFPVSVFRQGIPAVFPASITINVPEGAAVTNTQVVVTNSGNAAVTFGITDNGTWGTSYAVTTGRSSAVAAYTAIALNDPNTGNAWITPETEGVSDTLAVGFRFPLYGAEYSNFYVTADGYIGLLNTTNIPVQSVDRAGALPSAGGLPLIAPFWGKLKSPAGSIRYIRNQDSLVISYSNVSQTVSRGGTNLEFQTALFNDGRIEFRYKQVGGAVFDSVTTGIQGSTGSYTNLAVAPVNGTSVLLTPQRSPWVRYTPSGGTVGPLSSQIITFLADATGKTAGAGTNFTAQFNWNTGGSNSVAVSANVITAAPVYSAVSSLSFTGTAGQVSSVPFIITNTGTGPLNFSIRNNAAAADGYSSTNPACSWIDISATGTGIVLNDPSPNPYITAADEGFSAMIPVGFSFPFYGRSYTQLCVSVNGALRLDTTGRVFALNNLTSAGSNMPAQLIAPYRGDLVLDENATLKYHSTAERLVVTWENVRQYGQGGGSNLTFQAVLRPSGDITFQYKKLEGAPWANTVIGLRDTADRTLAADLRLPGDWSVSTSAVSGVVSTQYVGAVSNRAAQFQPARIQVIGCMPDRGSIAAGGTAEITITGDASSQSIGTNRFSTNATLTITHNAAGSPEPLAVTFTVTNSQETVFVRAAAAADDSDGDGVSDDAERIAGTDPQNAASVFTPAVTRTAGGTVLSWPYAAGRTYTVLYTTNLMSPFVVLTGGWQTGTFIHATDAPVNYYKITAE